ncbi:hypothetical protein DMN91_006647 [Ooceraea biroi]|uniref:Uncharacterized protein n=1 Tax=Ooceraea biroi TaxID=2015173 RepID=A0A3L8DI68_OOCBI|nr:hypothetical protein DMN91_006647 [Ooceraea biroi]
MPWIKCLGGGGGKARRGKPLSVSQPIHLLVKPNQKRIYNSHGFVLMQDNGDISFVATVYIIKNRVAAKKHGVRREIRSAIYERVKGEDLLRVI